ncbi:MAG: pilin [Candidatus Marithrix sp.]|nr:pilin [Candidatus Marithrix sp.]
MRNISYKIESDIPNEVEFAQSYGKWPCKNCSCNYGVCVACTGGGPVCVYFGEKPKEVTLMTIPDGMAKDSWISLNYTDKYNWSCKKPNGSTLPNKYLPKACRD